MGLILKIALNIIKIKKWILQHWMNYSSDFNPIFLLTVSCIMSQNGQTHFKDLEAAATFLTCVWPFWDIMHWRVNREVGKLKTVYKLDSTRYLTQSQKIRGKSWKTIMVI